MAAAPLGRNPNGRYPVAYFPIGDFAEGALRPTDHCSVHAELGETAWFEVISETRTAARGAWQHVALPDHASILEGKVALAWRLDGRRRARATRSRGRLNLS